MNPGDEKTLAIARRSKKNLKFIDEQKRKGVDVEEFTQLLNSMLGMLICLREDYFKGRQVSWEDVKAKGLVPIRIEGNAPSSDSPNLRKITSFSKLISNMRHAFAHNNFELKGEPNITGIRVWNVPGSTPVNDKNEPRLRIWEADLSESQLKEIAFLFIDFIEKELGMHSPLDSSIGASEKRRRGCWRLWFK